MLSGFKICGFCFTLAFQELQNKNSTMEKLNFKRHVFFFFHVTGLPHSDTDLAADSQSKSCIHVTRPEMLVHF